MAKESVHCIEEWMVAADLGQRLELCEEMMKYALRVSSEILLGSRVDDEKSNRALCDAMNVVIGQLGLMGNTLSDTTTAEDSRRQRIALGLLERILQHLIVRRSGRLEGHDLLGVMINMRDESGAPALTATELRDEVATILLGGHETTSVALTWAFWELGSRPELVAELVAGEWKEVLAGQPPTWEQIPQLARTRSVVQEILRMHPPVWSLVRETAVSSQVGPHELPAGEYVLISPFIAHRREASWDRPEEFLPDRFLEGTTKEQSRGRYLPFGAGPHTCVGQHFAMMELMITLPTLLQHFELDLESHEEPRAIPLITLRAEGPIHFRLRKRRR
jgi:cytochrome P450